MEAVVPRVAFYTFAIGKGAFGSEVMGGFIAMLPSVFRLWSCKEVLQCDQAPPG